MTTVSNHDSATPGPKWRERLRALGNIPPVFKMVWEAAPKIVVSSLAVRVILALIPVAMLAVTRLIIDSIDGYTAHRRALPHYFWWLVALEFGLAGLSTVLARLIDFFDTALAVRYAHHVSVRTMKHASASGPELLRRSGGIRQIGARSRARNRPDRDDSIGGPMGAGTHHHREPGREHLLFFPVALVRADRLPGARHSSERRTSPSSAIPSISSKRRRAASSSTCGWPAGARKASRK